MVYRPLPEEQNREPTWELVEMLSDVIGTGVPTTSVANSTASGTIDATGEYVECDVSPGAATVGCQLSGGWAAAGNLIRFEATTDNVNWVSIYTSMGASAVITTGQNGIYQLGAAGYRKVRTIGAAGWTIGNSCSVFFNSTVGGSAVVISTPLPQGANALGSVITHSSLVPYAHDNIKLNYLGADLDSVNFKVGATTVSTIQLTYFGGKLDTIELI